MRAQCLQREGLLLSHLLSSMRESEHQNNSIEPFLLKKCSQEACKQLLNQRAAWVILWLSEQPDASSQADEGKLSVTQ